MTRARVLVMGAIAALVVILIVGARWVMAWGGHRDTASGVAVDVRAPDGSRVRVQVLNATKTRGLARRATMLLRDHGFDVVETGTLAQTLDTTVVLDLSGHPDWAKRVAQLFGVARVQARPDTSRYLDIAVLLGATWRPPAQPFYP
jgi:hypothetical protein